ncbi:MAG: DUF2442 domain-containing protein [Methylobacter sp.]|nr:DUF2442 domain-containing protein [Methylobacter sp.]MDP2097638.1 DUF2442 domain-containing protein [Methylobacter sp.]MDP2430250.1 DUF2442 domain-containing protein [Methylobacter sp.]MDP3056383.1 DUF2442 domain-containing protein [Methylobacter sp.]MDP3361986.1 DUF2442 domain-containing protein [Methylobacter sp.]
MNPRVVTVEVLENYQLHLTFSNGEMRIFNVAPYLDYPAFNRLRDKGYFTLAKVAHGTVCWPDDIDFCPDTIYLRSNNQQSGNNRGQTLINPRKADSR